MCDKVTLLDGSELSTLGELVDDGLMPESDLPEPWAGLDPRRECLCGADLAELFAASGRRFKPSGWGWVEFDAEGRSYWADGLMRDPDQPEKPDVVVLVRNPAYPHHKP